MNISLPKAWLLDVGHGNSAVVETSEHVSVIDGGQDDTLLEFLSARGISHIDTVIASHADSDHFRGISLLLSDPTFHIEQVYINPDSRDTDLWEDFGSVMIDAKLRGTTFHLELNSTHPGSVKLGQVVLEVLAPSQEVAYRTSNGLSPDGRRLSANAMSAVVRVSAGDAKRLLLTGDIDSVGLDDLLNGNPDLASDVLVFPHHGGRSRGGNLEAFTKTLISRVGSKLVVFSIGRNKYRTPRPEIVSTITSYAENIHIACTQLSGHCSEISPSGSAGFHNKISRGYATNECCAGTLEISLDDDFEYYPTRNSHLQFILESVSNALCQKGPSTP